MTWFVVSANSLANTTGATLSVATSTPWAMTLTTPSGTAVPLNATPAYASQAIAQAALMSTARATRERIVDPANLPTPV